MMCGSERIASGRSSSSLHFSASPGEVSLPFLQATAPLRRGLGGYGWRPHVRAEARDQMLAADCSVD
jgi:hypothetical protein